MDEARQILAALSGAHSYDRSARAGSWFAIWIFVFLPAALAGIAEAYLRGWTDIRVTRTLVLAGLLGGSAGAVWITTFNQTQYRVDEGTVECVTVWPLRPWRVTVEEIESALLEMSNGQWVLLLKLRGGLKRKLVLTKSMREKLGL